MATCIDSDDKKSVSGEPMDEIEAACVKQGKKTLMSARLSRRAPVAFVNPRPPS